jgi:uncharacterized protein YeaO (DUF488 family)
MIFTASYFQGENHHGKRISISRSEPRGAVTDGKLWLFVPDASLLADYRAGRLDERGYTARYREQVRRQFPKIKAWLDALDPDEDLTLLCWEKAGDFCHRNLAIKFVERYRPDCFGGKDIRD